MIKLYGIGNGYGSRAQVTRGFLQTIESLGLLTAFQALDQDDGSFERRGDGAPIGIMTGPIEWSPQVSPAHKRRFALVAPNATKIPKQMGNILREFYTDIIVPSQWCVQAVDDLELPVHVVPHGVFSSEIAQANCDRSELAEYFARKYFNMVHFSTSGGNRKGTLELLEGFQVARSRLSDWNLNLVLVLDHAASLRVQSLYTGSMEHAAITPRLDGPFIGSGMDPKWFADGMRQFHAVIQPSRGEAFGLIPLEARAAGVPAIMTYCSGHYEHSPWNMRCPWLAITLSCCTATPIANGPDVPADDCDGAMVSSVTAEAIADAIERSIETWEMSERTLVKERQFILDAWDWKKVTAPFIQKITR